MAVEDPPLSGAHEEVVSRARRSSRERARAREEGRRGLRRAEHLPLRSGQRKLFVNASAMAWLSAEVKHSGPMTGGSGGLRVVVHAQPRGRRSRRAALRSCRQKGFVERPGSPGARASVTSSSQSATPRARPCWRPDPSMGSNATMRVAERHREPPMVEQDEGAARGGDDRAGEHVEQVSWARIGGSISRVGVRHVLAQGRERRAGELRPDRLHGAGDRRLEGPPGTLDSSAVDGRCRVIICKSKISRRGRC